MRKILFVLAVLAVLGLGGCSVSDDDGGENNGDDKNMAVTVYPYVVEASRTVVDGGYLVDYFFVGNEEVKGSDSFISFVNSILKVLKVSLKDDGTTLFNSFHKIVDGSFCFLSVDENIMRQYELSYFQKNSSDKIQLTFVSRSLGTGTDIYTMISRFGSGEIVAFGSQSALNHYSLINGKFTIFEPKE